MVDRVMATPEAIDLIEVLKSNHGPDLLFMQACGGCDHSSVYCYKKSEFMVAPQDVLIGEIGGVPYYVDLSQHEVIKRRQIVIGVVKGDRSGDFSLEGTEGLAFRVGTRQFTVAECAELEASGVP